MYLCSKLIIYIIDGITLLLALPPGHTSSSVSPTLCPHVIGWLFCRYLLYGGHLRPWHINFLHFLSLYSWPPNNGKTPPPTCSAVVARPPQHLPPHKCQLLVGCWVSPLNDSHKSLGPVPLSYFWWVAFSATQATPTARKKQRTRCHSRYGEEAHCSQNRWSKSSWGTSKWHDPPPRPPPHHCHASYPSSCSSPLPPKGRRW